MMLTIQARMRRRTTKRRTTDAIDTTDTTDSTAGNLGSACASGLYVQGTDMSNRCNQCNSMLRLSMPPLGERDGVCRCTGCGRVFLVDNEDPAELPCCDDAPLSYVPERPAVAAWLN